MKTRDTAAKPLRALAFAAAFFCAALASAGRAGAQEAFPNDFVPAPAGTNILLGYYGYGHNTRFDTANGPSLDASLETHIGIARFVHYFELAGRPAGVQAFQVFGALNDARIGNQRLGSASGAQNLALSAFFWPYANQAEKTYLITAAFLYPPTGTYDRRSPLNVGDNRWRGNFQIGLNKGIGQRFSFDAGIDATFYGENDQFFPGDRRLTQEPSYRGQVWLNWAWSPRLTTSLGWLGLFGGRQQLDNVFNGAATGTQRIRAAALFFVTPTLQAGLELNHDFTGHGGFRQEFGSILRVAYIF